MGSNQSTVRHRNHTSKVAKPGSLTKDIEQGQAIYNNNSNVNYINGPGKITNNNHVYVDARPLAPPVPYTSVSATLPAKPIVFHGRENFLSNSVQLLTASGTVRIAIIGSGGMGKTTLALALLYNANVVDHFRDGRWFLSCEALIDADAVVVSLAKLLGLPASGDLLTAVIAHIEAIPRVLLVIDNLETVWSAGGVTMVAVEELLGRLAQISSLSLIITCRGVVLPQSVEWSNADTAALEPFSLEAALETFQARTGRPIAEEDKDLATQLLNEVDRMPLAVSLLGQLARRGIAVSELFDRWNRERTALLQTDGTHRINSVNGSIGLSIKMMCAADESRESLQLLSLCSMMSDGLRPRVFDKLRPLFRSIDRARDKLTAYALAGMGEDRVLKALSPIRHFVLQCYPARSGHRDALCSIYIDIAGQLPTTVDENFQELAVTAAPEMGNLSSLLLTMVDQPSQQVVDAVVHFTLCAYWQQPTLVVIAALLQHLEPYPKWKARCLQTTGNVQAALGDFRAATQSFTHHGQRWSMSYRVYRHMPLSSVNCSSTDRTCTGSGSQLGDRHVSATDHVDAMANENDDRVPRPAPDGICRFQPVFTPGRLGFRRGQWRETRSDEEPRRMPTIADQRTSRRRRFPPSDLIVRNDRN